MTQRSGSFKRTGDEHPAQRPAKRSSSPRNSQIYLTPPSTPRKPSKKLNGSCSKDNLITSFQKVFRKTSFSNLSTPSDPFKSPLSSASTTNPFSLPSPAQTFSPRKKSNDSYSFLNSEPIDQSFGKLEEDFQKSLSLEKSENGSDLIIKKRSHQIFSIPEILLRILSYVDDFTIIPHEESPVRRRPLSYQHALLIYNDEKKASSVWKETLQTMNDSRGLPSTFFKTNSNSLYNCLFVNKLWSQVTMELATTKLFFMDYQKWESFLNSRTNAPLRRSKSNTKLFILHKLSKAKQSDLEKISPFISGQLECIEMYICPKILPTPSMLTGSVLKKLTLPGSKFVDDLFLRSVAKNCPRLESLDLRECLLVSDIGIMSVSKSCKQLKFLNLGRHSFSDMITDVSLFSIALNNPKVKTLGFAGCAITDRGLWELVIRCSNTIERLSLNKCSQLTNDSIPKMIESGYLPNLSVLEVRHILNLTNVRPFIEFKRTKELLTGQHVLIEGCEVLEYRMRQEERKLDIKNSTRMFNDILMWCNDENDGDLTYPELIDRHMK